MKLRYRTSWPLSHSLSWRCSFSTPSRKIQRQRSNLVRLSWLLSCRTCDEDRQQPRLAGSISGLRDLGAAEDQKLRSEGYQAPGSVHYMKQTIGNACGTIGALHAIANNEQAVSIGAAPAGHEIGGVH